MERTALQELAATAQKLCDAVRELQSLDNIEAAPNNALYWIEIRNTRGNKPSEIEDRLVQSMKAAAKRRAAEMGAVLRAEALEKATAEIDTLRAVLCSQAASATIELARIVRDARERG